MVFSTELHCFRISVRSALQYLRQRRSNIAGMIERRRLIVSLPRVLPCKGDLDHSL